jgi:hypothetical protein
MIKGQFLHGSIVRDMKRKEPYSASVTFGFVGNPGLKKGDLAEWVVTSAHVTPVGTSHSVRAGGRVIATYSFAVNQDVFDADAVALYFPSIDAGVKLLVVSTSSGDRKTLIADTPEGEIAAAVRDVVGAINDAQGTVKPSVDTLAAAVEDVTGAINSAKAAIAPSVNTLSTYPLVTTPLDGGASSGGPNESLKQKAAITVQQVLGWKPRNNDPKSFVGALTQSFKLTDFEGHIQAAWTPRTYTVQSDFAGSLSGSQASIYNRAVKSVAECQTLLDGLRSLRVVSNPDDVEALKSLTSTQLDSLVAELGRLDGPRIPRVNQTFVYLLGADTAQMDPDKVTGLLGSLRDELGLKSTGLNLVNTIAEEQVPTDFRIMCDYLTSLRVSWVRDFANVGGGASPFFGTRIVLINRQFATIVDTVDELRRRFDSMYLREAERDSIRISDTLFLEDLLDWVNSFASAEGPQQVRDGGKFGVEHVVRVTTRQLIALAQGAKQPVGSVPAAYSQGRIQDGWDELIAQLQALDGLLDQIVHEIPSIPGI